MAAVVAWNLWSLRAVVLPVAFLNDGSVHEMMARYASSVITAGQDPYTSWFPYIGLGSAQYLHYQSLGSVLTGLAGAVVGPDTAFRWSVYLLLSLWPFVIYSSARLFGLPRAAAAIAALLSPFIVSFTGVGYERGAYLWIGGAEVWTQLVGSWALPFAWASSWRAIRDARYLWVAGGLTGLTVALHFMSGDLAFLGIIVVALVAEGPLLRRLGRAAVLFVASLAAAAWVIVPLMVFTKWSAINQELATTGYVRGYGARQEVVWLFTGRNLRCAPRRPGDHRRRALGRCTGHREVATGTAHARSARFIRGEPLAQLWLDHLGPARRPGPGACRPVLPPLHDGEPTRRALPGRYSDSGGLARVQLDSYHAREVPRGRALRPSRRSPPARPRASGRPRERSPTTTNAMQLPSPTSGVRTRPRAPK